jgi:hypothetical protein
MNILFISGLAASLVASAAVSFLTIWCCCSRHTHLRKHGESIKDLKFPDSTDFESRDYEEIRKNNDVTRIKVFGLVAYATGHIGFFQTLYGTTLTLFILGVIFLFAILFGIAWLFVKDCRDA